MLKKAVVVGSGSGTGRAAAERLFNAGFELALLDLQVFSLVQMERNLRAEVFEADITDMAALQQIAAAYAPIEFNPVPRLGSPTEMANVIAFLCSQEASYITGSDVLVDGGWVAAVQAGAPDSDFSRALARG